MGYLSACGTHRQPDADQHLLAENQHDRSNGCGTGGKNEAVLVRK